MADEELNLYRISWNYWEGDDRGDIVKGSVHCAGKNPDDALERFKSTRKYQKHVQLVEQGRVNPRGGIDSLFSVKEVKGKTIRLPALIGEGADDFEVDVSIRRDGKEVILEYIVVDKD
jgi:hypothetical protein